MAASPRPIRSTRTGSAAEVPGSKCYKTTRKRRSPGQKASLKAAMAARWSNGVKENDASRAFRPPTHTVTDTRITQNPLYSKLRTAQAGYTRVRKDKKDLQAELRAVKAENKVLKKTSEATFKLLEMERKRREAEKAKLSFWLDRTKDSRDGVRKHCDKLRKQVARFKTKMDHAIKHNTRSLTRLRIMRKGAYEERFRALARAFVRAGCTRHKVGELIVAVGKTFGVQVSRAMSSRTVRRAIGEGGVAAKVQAGYELSITKAFTLSADSTGYRKTNLESRHFNSLVPAYEKGETQITPNSKPAIRFLGITASIGHTSEDSFNVWRQTFNNLSETFNASPLARRRGLQLTLLHILKSLRGICGDHASTEIKTGILLMEFKRSYILYSMGEERLVDMGINQAFLFIHQKRTEKLEALGGPFMWGFMTVAQREAFEVDLMHEVKSDLGNDQYNQLSDDEKQDVDLFFRCGCCMHKDHNCVKGGCDGMHNSWEANGRVPPIRLANKVNAAIIREALTPGRTGKMTDAERMAIEATTRGAVKLCALAGALFNNKDNKKGLHNTYQNYFISKYGSERFFPQFPPTSDNRFGSHGLAACFLLVYLEDHIAFLDIVRWSKNQPGFTNIEHNIYHALHDIPTLTELAVLVLYTNTVSCPYLRVVRMPGVNGLTLGDFHRRVLEFIKRIANNPLIIMGPEVSCQDAALDGKEWQYSDAMEAVKKLSPTLPHLQDATAAFFSGAATSWERFMEEYKVGGKIDMATKEQLELAWMPATNDCNEGALGSTVIALRDVPNKSFTQLNSEQMAGRNHTDAFMTACFEEEDHAYVRRTYREIDASGEEARQKAALTEELKRKALEGKEKQREKEKQAAEDRERLGKVKLATTWAEVKAIPNGKLVDVQLQALKKLYGAKLPPLKDRESRDAKNALLYQLVTEHKDEIWKRQLAAGTNTRTSEDGNEQDLLFSREEYEEAEEEAENLAVDVEMGE